MKMRYKKINIYAEKCELCKKWIEGYSISQTEYNLDIHKRKHIREHHEEEVKRGLI